MKIKYLLKEFIIPPGFLKIKQRIFNTKKKDRGSFNYLTQENIQFKDIHKGKRCFILATGPSIRTQDLKLLKDEFSISVSNFFVHPDYSEIRPVYHCMASYHPPITEEGWRVWMKELAAKTVDSTLFFGLSDVKRNQDAGVFADRSVHYLHCGRSLDSLINRRVDLTKQIIGPASVPVMALHVALYMGFKRIYLLGCDHDWIFHVNQSNHFYEEKEHVLVKSGYNEWSDFDWGIQFAQQAELWQQYKVIKLNAESCGVEIFNATPVGILDVFPRVKFESLFKPGFRPG
jgi:hypothetical protein